MKFFLVLALVGVAVADRLENTYLPPSGAAHSGGSNGAIQAPYAGAASGAGSRHTAAAPPPAILKYSNENNGEGTYEYSFETENGIQMQESGSLKNAGTDSEVNVVRGSYSYTDADGQHITVNYVADENGFRAEGAHLPTPPPIPEAILRSLELNAAEEAAESRGGQTGYSSGPAQNGYPSGGPAQNGYPSGPAPARPNNAYVPPKQAARRPTNTYVAPKQAARRPSPSFNQQSGYNY